MKMKFCLVAVLFGFITIPVYANCTYPFKVLNSTNSPIYPFYKKSNNTNINCQGETLSGKEVKSGSKSITLKCPQGKGYATNTILIYDSDPEKWAASQKSPKPPQPQLLCSAKIKLDCVGSYITSVTVTGMTEAKCLIAKYTKPRYIPPDPLGGGRGTYRYDDQTPIIIQVKPH